MKHASVLPDEWPTLRLKHLLAEPLKYGANEAALSDDPNDPRFVRITDIADDGTLKPDTFRSLPPEVAQPYLLKDGDLLFARSGATVGKSVMYSETWGPCCFAGYLIRARPDSAKALPEYVRYFCESLLYWQYITSEQIQATIQNVSAERYGNLPLPMPSIVWQRKIVEFLNRETAKIDALIVKQEHLIAALREDRTATITHAVTKGLDPHVEMRESGVEWLGEIPSHWTHSLVKYAATLVSGHPFKSDGFTHDVDDIRLLRGANVGVDTIDWTDVVRWPRKETAALANYELKRGDIVMGLDRPFISTGIRVSRIGPTDLPSLLLQRVARLRAMADFEQDYLFHLLSGPGIVHHLTPMFTGVSVPHVSPDQVGSLPIPQPPLAEQRQIVSYLADRCSRIDALVNKAHTSIEVLREFRSALITDAVTGKIDVRGAA